MKRFKFRLDKILDYRSHRVKKAQVALARARNECNRMEQEAQKLSRRRVASARECRAEGVKGLDVARYRIYQDFLHGLSGNIEKVKLRHEEGLLHMAAKEALLIEESVKKKALESLKDFKYKKFKETSEREEQKSLDETAIIERNRKA